jgi:hypothetical protein
MSNSFFPPQIGFIPTTGSTGINTSTLYLGRNVDTTWEAVGFGQAGRPDYLETLYLNLTKLNAGVPDRIATLAFNVADVQTIITSHSNAGAAALTFQIREVDVCSAGVAKKMMILASAPYSAT